MHPEFTEACYHCGEPVPTGLSLRVDIEGESRAMCCPGCQAVAQLIAGNDLQAFYRLRTDTNQRPLPLDDQDSAYLAYDLPENQEEFVRPLDNGERRVHLLVSGISCAACTWLIEQSLQKLPGVSRAEVNLASHELRVEWQPQQLPLSQLFRYVAELGYQAHPWQATRGAELIQAEQRQALAQLAVAGVAMMQVGMFAIALHAGDIQGIAAEYRSLMRWVSLLIASFVVMYSARSFFRNAWLNLKQAHLVMDLPVALAIGLAWAASAWATITNSGQVYFDSIAMFTFFLLLGRFLERRVRQREILRQTDLQSLLPLTTQRHNGRSWEPIACSNIVEGDLILPTAGQVIPADGMVEAGRAVVDESAFSGETFPRSAAPGDSLSAGTLLLEGSPFLRVSAQGNKTRIAQLLELVSAATQEKPRLAQLADQAAAYFVAALLLVASAVALYWLRAEPAQALWVSLSVLVVSCPCALALATPAALATTGGAMRRRGLLMCGQDALQQLRLADTIVFDKTGTLTHGNVRLGRSRIYADYSASQCLGIARALEQFSNHPIAGAFAGAEEVDAITTANSNPGRGVSGYYRGQELRIGTADYVAELNSQLQPCPHQQGQWIALASAQATLAWFELVDEIRAEAADVVNTLQQRGMRVELLTGDGSDQGQLTADSLHMDAVNTGKSPAQKLHYIQQLQAQGRSLVMVGDGLNDAPVLAAADCSFAVSEATDLARARADVIVLNPDLRSIVTAFDAANKCHAIIRQNMAWAIAYNLLAVPFAAAGLIPPWAAAIGMSASSLLVVLNSMRLGTIGETVR